MRARTRSLSLALAAAALLAGGPPAAADTVLTAADGGLRVFSEDAGVGNDLAIALDARGRLRLADDRDPLGMRFPDPPCEPGQVNSQANVVEVFCDRAAVPRIAVDIGPGEDRVEHRLGDTPAMLAGGLGADVLRAAGAADALAGQQGDDQLDGGGGDDELRGGEGDDAIAGGTGADRVTGGAGADRLDAGAGDDLVQAADGTADDVDCGPGADTAVADALDTLTGCEEVARREVAPAPAGTPDDDAAPSLSVRAAGVQRGRRIRFNARASEDAILQLSGYLSARGTNSAVRASATELRAGERRRLAVRLSRAHARRAARAIRAGRRPRVRLTVAAVDAAGNTSRPERLTIRLRG